MSKVILATLLALFALDAILIIALPVIAVAKSGFAAIVFSIILMAALTAFGVKLGKDCMNRLFS